MTVLDRIKSLFRRAKPGAKAAEEKHLRLPRKSHLRSLGRSLLRPPSRRGRHPKRLGRRFQELASGKGAALPEKGVRLNGGKTFGLRSHRVKGAKVILVNRP